jgi:surface polysaccharide O-acyltransferase-like enzyme
MRHDQRMASIEAGRVIALFAVILIHAKPFLPMSMPATGWPTDALSQAGLMLVQSSRFAVPFFFVAAGWFIQPALSRDPTASFLRVSSPLIRIWLAWSLVYLLLPLNIPRWAAEGYLADRISWWSYLAQRPMDSLWEGGMVHLWYLPGLVSALFIVAIFLKVRQTRLLLPVALGLYVYGVLAGSYATLTELPSPWFTRNGPFMSTLMVCIGVLARQYGRVPGRGPAFILMMTGMAGHFFEAFVLQGYGVDFIQHDYLFSTAAWGAGLFFWLLAYPDAGRWGWLFWLSQRVLGIYVAHMVFIICALAPWGGHLLLKGLMSPVLILVMTLGLVLAIEKTPVRSLLLR